MTDGRTFVVAVVVWALLPGPGCGAGPARISDADEVGIYREVLAAAARTMSTDSLPVHPYLALIHTTSGTPDTTMTAFEYEPAAALRSLSEAGDVRLCKPSELGLCAEPHAVLSQIGRVAERDAFVVVQVIRGTASASQLMIRLRHHRGTWNVTGSDAVRGP